MASIEIIDADTINVSMREANTLQTSVASPESMKVKSNDGWYEKEYEETDPLFTASPASEITSIDITNWNEKQPAGEYADSRITNLEIDALFE